MRNKLSTRIIAVVTTALTMAACANMAQGPTGGAKDTTPPSLKTSTPKNRATHADKQRIEFTFDEYVQLGNSAEALIISPPQKKRPIAKAIGKKVIVELKDTLQPNTTYTLDFGNSIGDYTENNSVTNFCHTFSTGDQLDTLQLSGIVLNAEDLTPAANITVGVYTHLSDSTLLTQPFERIAKTGSDGRFILRGMAEKEYFLFAVEDMNGNFHFDKTGEAVALNEQTNPTPYIQTILSFDTLYKDSTVIDTIITKKELKYGPDTLLLRLFKEKKPLQEFVKLERNERKTFTLFFKKEENSLPQITPLNFQSDAWHILERSAMNDTVKYWLTDTSVYQSDTLRFAIEYLKTDTSGALVTAYDTLSATLSPQFLKNEKKEWEQNRKREERLIARGKKITRSNILKNEKVNPTLHIYATPAVIWPTPIEKFDTKGCHLFFFKDSIPEEIDFVLKVDTNNPRRFFIQADIKPDVNHRFVIDSASVSDYYGNHNDSLAIDFKKRPEDNYCTLTFHITPTDQPCIVQLLNRNDAPVRTATVEHGEVVFRHLDAGEYFARLFIDTNGNGKWDTGVYGERQPEEVFYFSKKMNLRAGWSNEEDWNIHATPLHEQRPSGLSSQKQKNKR